MSTCIYEVLSNISHFPDVRWHTRYVCSRPIAYIRVIYTAQYKLASAHRGHLSEMMPNADDCKFNYSTRKIICATYATRENIYVWIIYEFLLFQTQNINYNVPLNGNDDSMKMRLIFFIRSKSIRPNIIMFIEKLKCQLSFLFVTFCFESSTAPQHKHTQTHKHHAHTREKNARNEEIN